MILKLPGKVRNLILIAMVFVLGACAGSEDPSGDGGDNGSEMMKETSVKDVVPSSGCGMPAFANAGAWERQPDLKIDGRTRRWHVRLPNNYDPDRAYPLIFKFHGCGGKDNNTPIERVSGSDAIHVRGESVAKCWNDLATGTVTNNTESFDGWIATILACKRANIFRGLGSIAGADWVHINKLDAPQCSEGNVARMFISDVDDRGSNRWDNHKSAQARLVERNSCTPNSEVAVAPSPCVRFQGCGDFPVQRCITKGNGHGRQDSYAPGAFWTFFSEL